MIYGFYKITILASIIIFKNNYILNYRLDFHFLKPSVKDVIKLEILQFLNLSIR